MGKYLSIPTVEQSAPSSKVTLRYKAKHQVSRNSDFLRTISLTRCVKTQFNALKFKCQDSQGINHEKTDSR